MTKNFSRSISKLWMENCGKNCCLATRRFVWQSIRELNDNVCDSWSKFKIFTLYSIKYYTCRYNRIRGQRSEPVEEIDFTAFNFGSNEKVSFDKATISSEDVRVFKEELRVHFIRLLTPNLAPQIEEIHELADNKYALLPVLFENDVVEEVSSLPVYF